VCRCAAGGRIGASTIADVHFAGTHPVKTAPDLYYLRVVAAKKKNAPDEPDHIIGRRRLFRYTMNVKDYVATHRVGRTAAYARDWEVSLEQHA
jgi:hypothetical protein